MITRKKALIIIRGTKQRKDQIIPILRNHEGLVEIHSQEEVENVFKKNKTPIVDEEEFTTAFGSYEGYLLSFNVDMLADVSQPTITESITRYCYNRQIEPGEFKVKNVANNSADGCIFCNITKHSGTTCEYNQTAKDVNMIIYESPNFVVIPGLGPLAPGYLMIMTKEHYLSLAQIPDSLMKEYLEVEEDVQKILTAMYGKPVFFYEHGTAAAGATGLKSIVHMHVHVMIDNELKPFYREMLSMRRITTVKDAGEKAYFYYKDPLTGEEWLVDDPEVYIQRQIHRQIYAEEHNLAKDQFNWRKTEFADQTSTNVWQLYDYLKSCTDSRIRVRTRSFVDAATARFE